MVEIKIGEQFSENGHNVREVTKKKRTTTIVMTMMMVTFTGNDIV